MNSIITTAALQVTRKIMTSSPPPISVKLAEIQTWTEYFNFKKHLGKITPTDPAKDEKVFQHNEQINSKVSLWEGDITKLEIDGIVNAANSSLLGGGGVDGAIHRKAGPKLYDECKTLNGCDEGAAKITKGYDLPSKHVIHTVGPQGEFPEILANCYKNSFKVAKENGLRSLAFPCIGTGVYGYPNEQAAHVALLETRKFLESNHEQMDRVIFCLFLEKDVKIYEDLMQRYFPV